MRAGEGAGRGTTRQKPRQKEEEGGGRRKPPASTASPHGHKMEGGAAAPCPEPRAGRSPLSLPRSSSGPDPQVPGLWQQLSCETPRPGQGEPVPHPS